MTFAMMIMVITGRAICIRKFTLCKSKSRVIRTALNARIQRDPRFCQSHLRSAAYPAADQCIDFFFSKKTGERTMPCAVCAYDPRVLDLAIRDFIDFELLRMAKVLKYITVFVCYCDLH